MKKYLQSVILFALLNTLLIAQTAVIGKATAHTSDEAELAAQNQFRRNLLVYTSQYYQDKLGKYWHMFYDSKQNIHREVLEGLTELAERRRTREKGMYTYTITLEKAVFEKFFADRLDEAYAGWGKINSRLLTVDVGLLAPNATLVGRLDRFATALQDLKIEYHNKYLLFQDTQQEIVLQAPEELPATLNFTYQGQAVSKTANNEGVVSLTISFIGKDTDLNIPPNSPQTNISFNLDIEKTFHTRQLRHSQFLTAFIEHYIGETSGSISILYVSDSFFYVRSTNLKSGISTVNDLLRRRGWGVGTAQRHTHQIVLTSEVIEQKTLAVGVYYVKACAVVDVYDSKRVKVQSRRSAEVEAIDNMSFDNCHAKVERLLLPLLEGLL